MQHVVRSVATLVALSAALTAAVPAFAHPQPGQGSGWEIPEAEILRENPVPPDARSLERGGAVYAELCIRCHGGKLLGDGPDGDVLDPPPANLIEHAPHHTDGDFAYRVRIGRGPMPAFADVLDERDIWNLVNFMKDQARNAALAGSDGHSHGGGGHHHHGSHRHD